jgi:cyanophycin synthetase
LARPPILSPAIQHVGWKLVKQENIRLCQWRNRFSPQPVLVATVSFGDALGWTTERLSPGVRSVFEDKLPGVLPASGVLEAPELLARLAQTIQLNCDLTQASCGVASRAAARGQAVVYFACRDPFIAPHNMSLAVQILDRLVQSDVGAERFVRMLKSCEDMAETNALERRTREVLGAAEKQGIPWFRTTNFVRHVQLGQGVRQKRFWNTLFSEPSFGRDYARHKLLTLTTLFEIKVPVGRFGLVKDVRSALKLADEIGYPVVLKPVDGHKGESVFVDLRNEAELQTALAVAPLRERQFLLQTLFLGDDHRLLVINGKLVAAARRIPASVTGDGRHTIAELVASANTHPGRRSRALMAPIELEGESDRLLARQGLSRESIVPPGHVVRIKGTANISTGGTAIDVMNLIHPDNASAAVRAARAIGLVITGVDFISPDISKPWQEVGGGICEVNTAVGLRPHYLATPELDICKTVIQAFYPEGDDGRIPTAMVTGTFGKTTVTLMLASILTSAGHTVGSATTESIRIGNEEVAVGDLAGVDGAAVVLRDATVTAAVLETARGGLIKAGTYLDHCDVAALLNVQREQIGIDGIETLDEMAALKRKVLDAATKAVVLNADDSRCLAFAPEFAPRVRTFLFSRDAESAALRDHRMRGGDAVFLDRRDGHETIMAASGADACAVVRTDEIPATHNGLFWQQSSNAMAACALAMGLGIEIDPIRAGLRRYGREFRAASCRLSFDDTLPVPILFDYAVSPPGYAATISAISAIPVSGRRICATTMAGNRPDWMFAESAAALVRYFDTFVLFEIPAYRRGRKPGEIAQGLCDALLAAGVDRRSISVVDSAKEAALVVAREATKDDLIVAFGSDTRNTITDYRAAFVQTNEPHRAQA